MDCNSVSAGFNFWIGKIFAELAFTGTVLVTVAVVVIVIIILAKRP